MTARLTPSTRLALIRTATALSLALVLSSSVKAGPINFNPTGGATVGGFNPGTITGVISFGLGSGDAIAKTSISNGGITVGSTFQLYYQTTITSFNTANGAVTPNGLNSAYQLTEIATFNETVTSIGSNGSAQFALTPGGANLTQIYFEDLTAGGAIKANAATGAGYSNGTLIMSLSANADNSTYTDTTKTGSTPGTVPLDGTGSGTFPGTTTDQGNGGVNLSLSVTPGYLTNFFQTPGINGSLFTSNITLPFSQIVPSTAFNNPFAPGAPTILTNVGSNNGTSGPDFLLQISGAAESFLTPEPASIAMTVLGLGGFAFGSLVSRRRRAIA